MQNAPADGALSATQSCGMHSSTQTGQIRDLGVCAQAKRLARSAQQTAPPTKNASRPLQSSERLYTSRLTSPRLSASARAKRETIGAREAAGAAGRARQQRPSRGAAARCGARGALRVGQPSFFREMIVKSD